MLENGHQCNLPDGALSSFYFIRPYSHQDRSLEPSVIVPTRTLPYLLAQGLQQQGESTKLQFLTALRAPAETRRAAGYIFESCSFFTMQDKMIKCKLAQSRSQRRIHHQLQRPRHFNNPR